MNDKFKDFVVVLLAIWAVILGGAFGAKYVYNLLLGYFDSWGASVIVLLMIIMLGATIVSAPDEYKPD